MHSRPDLLLKQEEFLQTAYAAAQEGRTVDAASALRSLFSHTVPYHIAPAPEAYGVAALITRTDCQGRPPYTGDGKVFQIMTDTPSATAMMEGYCFARSKRLSELTGEELQKVASPYFTALIERGQDVMDQAHPHFRFLNERCSNGPDQRDAEGIALAFALECGHATMPQRLVIDYGSVEANALMKKMDAIFEVMTGQTKDVTEGLEKAPAFPTMAGGRDDVEPETPAQHRANR